MRSEKKASKPIEKSEHNHALAFKGLLLLFLQQPFVLPFVIANFGATQKENWKVQGRKIERQLRSSSGTKEYMKDKLDFLLSPVSCLQKGSVPQLESVLEICDRGSECLLLVS